MTRRVTVTAVADSDDDYAPKYPAASGDWRLVSVMHHTKLGYLFVVAYWQEEPARPRGRSRTGGT